MSTTTTEPTTSTALVTLEQQIQKLDALASECSIVTLAQAGGQFGAALNVADKIAALREALTPEVMKRLMSLQGTSLGFRTDADTKGGYGVEVIRDVFIDATFRGFKLTGNETNIISKRFYGTKEGFEARMRDFARAGLMTDLKIVPGIPKTMAKGAEVHMQASWRWKNVPDTLEVDIPVKTDDYSSADQVLGKARRKILAAIYSRVTGTEVTEGEVGDVDTMKRAEPLKPEEQGAGSTGQARPPAEEPLDAALIARLVKKFGEYEGEVNLYLRKVGWITDTQSYRNLSKARAEKCLDKPEALIEQAKQPAK